MKDTPNMINHTIVAVLIILCINSIIIGYILCRTIHSDKTIHSNVVKFGSHKDTNPKSNSLRVNEPQNIIIDDSKFVVSLDTTKLEKKYDSLGKTTQSSENISGSIDKLKKMKG